VGLRIVTYWTGFMFWDAPYYIQMGRGLADGTNFVLPWGDPFSPAHDGFVPEPSHHFSPLYSSYLAGFYAVFGYSLEVTRIASILLSVLFLVVLYMTSRDLMGRDKALIVTAVFSLDPTLIITTRDLMPETLIIILFVLTIWAIIRGIDDDRYMVIAALCAAGGYLSKSSVGYLFIVAGVGGFAWRFAYIRWGVFKRKYYLAAIAIFLGIVAAWSLRNILTFGWFNWQTSPYLESALGNVLHELGDFSAAFVATVPFFVAIILMYGSFWLPWARRSLKRIREARTSALWLAVGLVLAISLWFSAALAIYEGSGILSHSAMRIRYLVIAFPPLMWAVMDEVELPPLGHVLGLRSIRALFREMRTNLVSLRTRRRRAASIAVLVSVGALLPLASQSYLVVSAFLIGGALSLLLTDPRKVLAVMLAVCFLLSLELATETVDNPQIALSEDLDHRLEQGQTVALDGSDIELGYLYVRMHSFDFNMTEYAENETVDFIISYKLERDYPGYSLVKVYNYRDSPGIIKRITFGLVPSSTSKGMGDVALWERS
jgi:4-amino-4-deoxy-L-arabinose transferase-like glycosyltransferase